MRTVRSILFLLLLTFLLVPSVQAVGTSTPTPRGESDQTSPKLNPNKLNMSRVVARHRDSQNKLWCIICSDDGTLCVAQQCG